MADKKPWETFSQPQPAASSANPWEDFGGKTEPEAKGVLGHAQDLGVSLLSGAVAVPEAAVGLADIPTGGAVGKFLENEGGSAGFRPKQAREFLNTLHTDQYKDQQKQFQDADGIIDKAGVALKNPSLIANTVAESAPSMLAGGAIGRGVTAIAPRIAPVIAGAAGEGAVMSGQQAEGIRQQSDDGSLTAGQAGAAVATGVLGGLFGYAGGRLANKLGIGDVDTMLAGGVTRQQIGSELATAPAKSIPRKVIEGAISEGFLEELPQSFSEQVIQNLATGKPWSEGVDEAVVMGTLAGMAMGGPAGAMHGGSRAAEAAPVEPTQQQATAPQQGEPLALPAPTIDVGPNGEAFTSADRNAALQAEAARQDRIARGEVADITPVPPTQQIPDEQRSPLALPAPVIEVGPNGEALTTDDRNFQIQEQSRAEEARRDRIARGEVFDRTPIEGAQAPTRQTESQAMGLNPAAGPMSSAAALAVDSGAHKQQAQQSLMLEAADAAEQNAKKPAEKSQKPAPAGATIDAETGEIIEAQPSPEERAAVLTQKIDYLRQLAKGSGWTSRMMAARQQAEAELAQVQPQAAPAAPAVTASQSSTIAAAPSSAPTAAAAPSTDSLDTTWSSMSKEQRQAVADKTDIKGVLRRNVANGEWKNLGVGVQQKLAQHIQQPTAAAPQSKAAKSAKPKPAAQALTDEQIAAYSKSTGSSVDGIRRIAENPKAFGVKDLHEYFESVAKNKVETEARTATQKADLARLKDTVVVRDDKAYELLEINRDKRMREHKSIKPSHEFDTQGVDLWEHYIGHPDSPSVKARLAAASPIDAAAHEAATSPLNDRPEPTDAQKEAGNYAKGHVRVAGMDIAIENPRGSDRKGKRPDGSEWSHKMSDHYGYIKRTKGADGEHVDTYIGSNPESKRVYVVDQLHQDTGAFDEHKVMLGFNSQQEAVKAYSSNFDAGWKIGQITSMGTAQFKNWLADGDTTMPLAKARKNQEPVKTAEPAAAPSTDEAAQPQAASNSPESASTPAVSATKQPQGASKPAKSESQSLSRDQVLARRLDTAKQEIKRDIASGKVPDSVKSFADLQDHVDANMYVNDADRADNLIGDLGRRESWKSADYISFTNDLIDSVNAWLAESAPKQPRGVLAKKAAAEAASRQSSAPDSVSEDVSAYMMEKWRDAKPSSSHDGWSMVDDSLNDNGNVRLVSQYNSKLATFKYNPKSGTDHQRARVHAIAWAQENPETSAPSTGELVAKPIFGGDEKTVVPAAPRGVLAKKAAADAARSEANESIKDFGEKIGGARKDKATTGAKKVTKSTDERPAWMRRFEPAQVVEMPGRIGGNAGKWQILDTLKKGSYGGSRAASREYFNTEEEARAAIPLIAVALKHRVVPVRQGEKGFEIWRDVSDHKRVKVVDQAFDTREAALEYMAKNAEAIITTNTTFGEADLPRPENTVRTGTQRRTAPAKDSDFMKTFGFRGVEFGNWNNQEERQQLLDDAYDGLMDLADVMGIPPSAMSLNGELALAFGARGQGLSGARAHYERSKAVINLTKMNGAGSLAHEWFHAVDHYFGRQDGKASSEWVTDADGTRSLKAKGREDDYASHGFMRSKSGVRQEVRDAYDNVMQTLFKKGEQYVEDTAKVDNFVARSRKDVGDRLDEIRRDLAEQKDPKYWKRSNKPATTEQLAEFDTVAQQILEGTMLETELRSVGNPAKNARSVMSGMRWTNDALEKLSEINKAVRGRTGFSADSKGEFDRLRGLMNGYSARLKMLAEAQTGEEKTKKVLTEFAMNAKELDQGRGGDYWTTPHEMAARAFQGYVEDKVAEGGGKSPFLNHAPENAAIITPWGWKRPYPHGTERKAINAAFDKLVSILETKQGDNGSTILFSRSGAKLENDLLAPLGKSRMVGDESLLEDYGDVKAFESDYKSATHRSIRYVKYDADGKPIAALQFRTKGPRSKKGEIQNIYTVESARRQGVASKLLRFAQQHYDIKHSDDLTNDGRVFKAADGVRYSFAGQSARGADLHSLASAQQQVNAGYDAETVRQETGWHRGNDGKWRFEISDDQAAMAAPGADFGTILANAQLEAITDGKQSLTVGDVLDHPRLFAAYPDMTSIKIAAMPDGETATAKVRQTATGPLVMIKSNLKRDKIVSALVHELQHVIQRKEGFALGGSKNTVAEWNQNGAADYKRLAGEVEARNSQSRLLMNDQFRAMTPPSMTADTASSDVIVTFNGRDVVNAPAPENIKAVPKYEMNAAKLVRAFDVQFPSLTPAIKKMLARGNRGEKGGAVVIESSDPLVIAKVFAKKTGRKFSDSVQMFSDAGTINGFYDPKSGLTFLVGPNINPVTGTAVLLHEMTHGQQREKIDNAALAMLMNRASEKDESLRGFLDRVADRMVDAGEAANAKEAAAYIVEQAVIEGRSQGYAFADSRFLNWVDSTLGKKVGDFLRSFLANVRQFMLRHGLPIGGQVSVDDLVAYAKAGVESAAQGDVLSEGNTGGNFSRSDAVTSTPAFKRWFGDSKVVDDEGKPLVVYHGTRSDFTEFDMQNPAGALGNPKGAYFSPDRWVAQRYAENDDGEMDSKSRVVAAYLHIENDSDGKVIDSAYRGREYVVFDAKNIKSATGNNGQFDPANPDIRFSRSGVKAMASKATAELNKTFNAPGKLSWWHKTIGSMYNLAERAPAFKPVFEAAQGFIDDVSHYAADASELAPNLLPKLETWKDITKSPVSAEDNKAVGKPIFEGTLVWARDLEGKPVRIEEMAERAAKLTTEEKADIMIAHGKLPQGLLYAWKGQGAEMFAKLIGSRYESQMLKAGIVWTDAELASMFSLNEQQIGLYHEFREATNRSLDTMARADMLRYGGDDVKELREAVMDAPDVQAGARILRNHLAQMASEQPDREAQLLAVAHGMLERADKVNELQSDGYAPLSRFGKYTVDVVIDGERQYFSLFETQREANTMAERMRKEFGESTVSQGTLSDESYKLFAGITPESLELFGNMLGLKSTGDNAQDQVFQEYLRLTKTNRSAMRRLIHRQGIAGFSEDVGRVLASFVYSNARQTAAGLNMGDMAEAIINIPKEQGELKDAAIRLSEYIKNPQEEAQAIRGLLFAQYLGGSVASAFVNMTQPFAVTFPWLSQHGGAAKSAKEIGRAAKSISTKGYQYEADLAEALKKAEDDGIVSPQEVHQLMAQARGAGSLRSGDGTKIGDARAAANNSLARLSVAWGKLFGAAEQVNRRITFIASYRVAKDAGIDNPAEFARKAVKETQFVYSKASKMAWGRGAVGGTLMTFKTYSVAYLELMSRLWSQGEPGSQERTDGRKAAALMIATLMLLGGAGGLPFEEDAEDLIDGAAQLMGYNFSTQKAKEEFLSGIFGDTIGRFIDKGVTGLPGVPLDVSGRLGMGNLIPGTGLLLEKTSHANDVLEIAGPMGDFATRVLSGAKSVASGDVGAGLLEMAPTAVRNAAKGIDMEATGMYRDYKGYKVLETNHLEAALKSIGFQPSGVARVQESNRINQGSKAFYNSQAQEIRSQWAAGIFEKDSAKVQKARDAVAEWNTKNPEQKMVIKIPDVMRRVREMSKNKDERIAATAPKAMRAQMKEDTARMRSEL